jgi:hypothetical protein
VHPSSTDMLCTHTIGSLTSMRGWVCRLASRLPLGFSSKEFDPSAVDFTRRRCSTARAGRASTVERVTPGSDTHRTVSGSAEAPLPHFVQSPRAQSSPGQRRPRHTPGLVGLGVERRSPRPPLHDRHGQPRPLTGGSLHSLSFFSDGMREGSVDTLSREQLVDRGRSASQVAQRAVDSERMRYKQRQMDEPKTAKILRMLHSLGDQRRDIATEVGPEITVLTKAMHQRYNKLFGALSANVNELNSALGIASEEEFFKTLGLGHDAASSLGASLPTSAAQAAAGTSPPPRDISAVSAPEDGGQRGEGREGKEGCLPHALGTGHDRRKARGERLSKLTRRVGRHGQLPYAGVGSHAGRLLAREMGLTSSFSTDSVGPERSSKSLLMQEAGKPLSTDTGRSIHSFFGEVSWYDDELAVLAPDRGADKTDKRLVRATMLHTSRIQQMNPATLVVRVEVARIRDVLPAKDVRRMVLVVSLNEDTRIQPLSIRVINRFLNASMSMPWKTTPSFDFFFDGVLHEAPLYIGVHKVPESWPESSGQMSWSLFAAETQARQNGKGCSGQSSCVASAMVNLEHVPPNKAPLQTSGVARMCKLHVFVCHRCR